MLCVFGMTTNALPFLTKFSICVNSNLATRFLTIGLTTKCNIPSSIENIDAILMIFPVRSATTATSDVTVMWSIHIGTWRVNCQKFLHPAFIFIILWCLMFGSVRFWTFSREYSRIKTKSSTIFHTHPCIPQKNKVRE